VGDIYSLLPIRAVAFFLRVPAASLHLFPDHTFHRELDAVMLSLLGAALTLSVVVSSQFVSPPTSLKNKTGYAGVNIRYKNVPTGICELDPKVRSIAG